MSRIVWDGRQYQVGLDRSVFYPKGEVGIPWNGLTLFEDEEVEHISDLKYYDGLSYQRRKAPGGFAGIINAYTYPEEFELYKDNFDLSFRTHTSDSYLIHLVYNVKAVLSNMVYQQEEADPFNWTVMTKPEHLYGIKSSSHFIIDASKTYPAALEQLEELLYGSHRQLAHMPPAERINDIFEDHAILRVTDHRDGTWTAEGPEEAFEFFDDHLFAITWPSAIYISTDAYTIHSL